MILSVLIVSYNVRYFLEHCLLSVMDSIEFMRSAEGWQAEVLVIDNASTDDSIDYLQPLFPSVKFIQSAENLGFGKANNRVLKEALGRYVLFLNPDTLVARDCFLKAVRFMESTPGAGACGVRMIDGSGKYLPESKRGFPGAWNSLSKMSGLIKAFPNSKLFAGYYEGHLDERETREVAILSGAWMMVRSLVLQNTGGFDERFFMYAEDIDLCYRIKLAGFTNHYFADTTIVHFKGESTSKDKIYTARFYTAMIQFVQKHFSGLAALVYIVLLRGMIKVKTMVPGIEDKKSQPSKNTGRRLSGTSVATGDPGAIRVLSAIQKRDFIVEIDNKIEPTNTGKEIEPALLGKEIEYELNSADEIIYCLGDHFSVSDLVIELQNGNPGVRRIFHPRAGAIIGSSTKNNQGIVEILAR